MESITLSRALPAPVEEVRDLILDVDPFMRAAGFDTVVLDGDSLTIGKGFALASIELDLRIVDDPDAVLAYEQVDGVFESMTTRYVLDPTENGCTLTVTTAFELDVDLVGGFLDATVIRRQRTAELTGQFDYLEAQTGD